MADLCTCESAFGNTGVTNCELIKKATYTIMLQAKYNEDGQKNFIDLTTGQIGEDIQTLTSAETHPLRRLYPLPVAENVTMDKTETVYEVAPSNRRYEAQDGVRTNIFQFLGANSSFRFLGELNKFGCKDLVYYIVDVNGAIWGSFPSGVTEDALYGVDVAKSTFDTMLMHATDTTVQKIQLQFDTAYNFDDSSWRGITASDLGYSATELQGLLSLTASVSSISTTGATVLVTYATNSAVTPKVGLKGLVIADFALLNVTDNASVTIATLTESPTVDGQYALTWTAQTSADVMEISASKGRYVLPATSFEIP